MAASILHLALGPSMRGKSINRSEFSGGLPGWTGMRTLAL